VKSFEGWFSLLEDWLFEQPVWISAPIWAFIWLFFLLTIFIVFSLIVLYIPWVLTAIPAIWLGFVIRHYSRNQGNDNEY